MGFRFRLTFSHATPGFFHFHEVSKVFTIQNTELILTARNDDTLSKATRFDIEACGFSAEEPARAFGERLRLRLRVLNSMLGLGLKIPVVDSTGASYSESLKQRIAQETGNVVLDSIVGLAVFPDDDRHFELVVAGRGKAYPTDPSYLFAAIDEVWPIEMLLDERANDALEILAHATMEASLRTKFLLTYLAAERMIDQTDRSDAAKLLIGELQECVRRAGLEAQEMISLCGALAQLHRKSFRAALMELAAKIASPRAVKGVPLRDFLSQCVSLRNMIAHNAAVSDAVDMQKLADGLREFVMMLIWTENRIPAINVRAPSSTIEIEKLVIKHR